MSYLAIILSHPNKNKLIQTYGNNHFKELYDKVKLKNLPFYEWHEWLKQELGDALIKRSIIQRYENLGFFKRLK